MFLASSKVPSALLTIVFFFRVVRIRRMREVNQEAVLLAMCSKTFTSKAIIFRFYSSIFTVLTKKIIIHTVCDCLFRELLVNSYIAF